MNIRKKLTIASVLMILIPILLSAALCIIVIFFRGSGTVNQLRDLYDSDNGMLNVQTILYKYKNQIVSYRYPQGGDGWDEDEDDDDDGIWSEWVRTGEYPAEDEDWQEEQNSRLQQSFGALTRDLSALGYYYEIRYNNSVILTNLPGDAKDKITALAGEGYGSLYNFAVTDGKDSAVKRTYADDERSVSVLAFCDFYESGSQISQALREIFRIAGVFAAFMLVTVVICIFVLTNWLNRGMMRSLNQLSEGVKQIQDGNLGYRIHSKKKDELGKACQEFDEMADYLERSVRDREKYEEARKRMLAGISHDLRTPLTSVKAYVEGLKDGVANTEQKKRRYYDAILTRTNDLESLIESLSFFSRFDRGEYHYDMEILEAGSLFDSFFRDNEIELKENHCIVRKAEWPQEEVYITGDRKQLKRVLGNLVDNAIKYRKKDETVITLELRKQGDILSLALEDDGPGVPEEDWERIFETFYRGDQARQNPGKGSGIGLAVVKEILKGHGAEIRAKEPKRGRGLRLVMDFPLKKEEQNEKNLDC